VRTGVIIALLVCLTACTWKPNAQETGAVTIELSSSVGTSPLTPSVSATVTATVYDQSNQGVTWMVTPLNFGTLSTQTSTNQPTNYQTTATVMYTAPANFSTTTTVTITATSISNPNVTASVPIKVSPNTVSLQILSVITSSYNPASSQTINPGQQLSVTGLVFPQTTTTEGVTWSLSPANAGSLINQTTLSVTYVAPTTVSSPLTATLTATSVATPTANASMQITILPSGAAPNVAALNVDGGPVPAQVHPNGAFTSVTVCAHGSTTACQNVDGVLVDTGSYGLRILQSEMPQLKLSTFVDGNGSTLENCVSNMDGSYLWGPVAQADVYIAGETTALTAILPIQIITSSNAVVPDGCSNGGTTNLNTPQLLGANGILGVGPEPTDCTLAGVNLCDGSTTSTTPNLYYTCPSVGCATTDSPVIVAKIQQVTNPVIFLSNTASLQQDNNGVILQLPSVSGPGSTLSGTLTFGIGTETNNALGAATVYDLDSSGRFTTIFSGQTLTSSFIDSGSNALFFPDTLPTCSVNTTFFCPTSLTNLSATIKGNTQGTSTVDFSVDNADNLFSTYPSDPAFSALAGPEGTYQSCSKGNISCVFDWGLPFFYGRTVYAHIDACTPLLTPCAPLTGAWWAY
jgi:hypothetical protein